MLIIRIGKAALVAAVALHASLAVFGNVTDYAINFTFVQHVLSPARAARAAPCSMPPSHSPWRGCSRAC
jgi:predicted small integral membrane protein